MARRTMAQRRLRAAAREDRRGVLAHLLSRSDRGVITDAERPLLRAHVEAELRDADDLRRTVNGQQKVTQRLGRQLDAAHDAIREAEQAAEQAKAECARLARDVQTMHDGINATAREAFTQRKKHRQALAAAEQLAADYAEQLRAYRAVEEQRQADLATWWTDTAAERRATHIRAFLDAQTAHLTTTTPEQQP
ncbi:hypothetical protein [Streptomyces salyersiae]|uniref:Uncharacterized protein n=1 Tax=Streptomyces salyersiae TaxID=3075530 RepID=A0ABU2RXY2_9ACTN|nr:hypothetical protein [Streptomyces sp. DSM 41770]MDT0432784.1 hypothetical protein [Streptomyces sp. DSM 41770]